MMATAALSSVHKAVVVVTSALLNAGVLVVALVAVTIFYAYPYRAWTLPFRNLQGPPPTSFVYGSFLTHGLSPMGMAFKPWLAKYGATLRYRSLLGTWTIVTVDPVVVGYIFNNTRQFHRQPMFNAFVERLCGKGVLCVEDADHRRQRRAVSSAFSAFNIRGMAPVLWEKSYELASVFGNLVGKGEDKNTTGTIDVHKYIQRATLDMIGLAGFNYDFESLSGNNNPMSTALFSSVRLLQTPSWIRIFSVLFPSLLDVPSKFKTMVTYTRRLLHAAGRQLVAGRKKELEAENIQVRKRTQLGMDAVSLLVKANMASDLRDDHRLSDDEVLGQIGALLLAGNETSATALAWASWHLAHRPDIQDKLRADLNSVDNDRPDVERLQGLGYLDQFVHELLRFDSPVHRVQRHCVEDTVVPLSIPVKGRDGKMMDSIRISKGSEISVAVNEINRSTAIWGPDAEEFNPERFSKAGIPLANVPSVWGNLTSFGAGPHNCLGYRFALMEIKIVLVRNFKFELDPADPVVERRVRSFTTRPVVAGRESEGIQMPVVLRAIKGD
ncbi:Cytochrome P450 monooxygenase FUM15 [Vanrija pseudolonga]|uniref:Cytochrome P450 monooxygenase FUM15 n=1 Tax=Vanrija pseudolonga TaxID=143232 RepID=A0AAF0YBJ8_9TREE|nr:Cytochrome P450 monooxygenase FUM15 [Vanrija pseudolonga]